MLDINENVDDIKPYIPGKPIEEVQRELGLDQIVKLASNENNRGIPQNVINKLQTKIQDLFLYPDGSLFRLRKKLAQYYKIDADQLIFGNGSDELLQMIAFTYLNKNKEVLISEGTFSEYTFAAKLVNAPIKYVSLKDYTYDLEAIAMRISAKTRVVFLCNPNNPTGTYFNVSTFESFMKKVPPKVLVVIDEAYYEYASGDDYPETIKYLKRYENIILLRTFSKVWSLAGCRIGYGIASPKVIASINKSRQPFNVNRFAEESALAMLDEKEWVHSITAETKKQMAYLYSELDKMKISYLSSRANFVFMTLKHDAKDVFDRLLRKGIIIRPMTGFGYVNSIRVTIGLPHENKLFIEALKKVLQEINAK
ncbi:MAG: histidinol-phosphate transaminase [Candidatus Margulisbacteria bacterium GWF2_35_9]|nr:MAG: histidinol-phosphate transaminase [Candidatus Margulisbacteria bacterium GWF2_35_9]